MALRTPKLKSIARLAVSDLQLHAPPLLKSPSNCRWLILTKNYANGLFKYSIFSVLCVRSCFDNIIRKSYDTDTYVPVSYNISNCFGLARIAEYEHFVRNSAEAQSTSIYPLLITT